MLTAGYLGGSRLDARLYNLTHSTVLLAALAGLGWWQSRLLVLAPDLAGSRPLAARNMQHAAEPARTVQRRRSPDQKGLPLNVTCPAARIRPEELT